MYKHITEFRFEKRIKKDGDDRRRSLFIILCGGI